jgi:uncharacterized protein YdbL (DUF1318 family)
LGRWIDQIGLFLSEEVRMMKKKPFWILVFSALIFAFACVTINIYFPAEKVESVAGEIVKDVRGQKVNEKEKPAKDDKGSLLLRSLWAFTPAKAWAEDAITVSNPTIRALKDKLRSNYAQMKPYYQKGMVVEGNNGYISLRNTDALNLKERRDLTSLADAENQYRRQLYEEVAKALKIDPSQVNRVAEIFAKEWQKPVR